AEAGTQLETAKADAKSKLDAAAVAKDAAKAAQTRKSDTAKAASEAKLALEPVSVYISRATQKLYVRRNTHKPWPDGGEVFDATIEAPVTIRNPDKPIGTHVFTAVAPYAADLRSMSPLRAATTGVTTASASFPSAIGIPNLATRARAPANTINRCNRAGGKTRHAARRPTTSGFPHQRTF